MTWRTKKGKITINGCVFEGDQIFLRNNAMEIDGKDITAQVEERPLKVEINGDVEKLETDLIVVVNGDVGSINCKGSVSCRDVGGSIIAGGTITAGAVKGSAWAWAGDSVNCENVEGDAIFIAGEGK